MERGDKLFAAGKYKDAALEFEKAAQKGHGSGPAYYKLGLADERLGKGLEAFQSFSKAVSLMPRNKEAVAKLGDLSFTVYAYSPSHPKRFYDTASAMADRLVAEKAFEGFRLKGDIALFDRKPKDAIIYLQQAMDLVPSSTAVALSLTQALIADNRFPEAEKLGLQLIARKPDYGSIYDVLFAQYRVLKRNADAENILQTKVRNNPKESTPVLQLAGFYQQSNKRELMVDTLQRLLGDPATFPQARLLVGDFYKRLGDWEEALRQYAKGAQESSKDKAEYQIRIASVQATQVGRDAAIGTLETVLKEHPENDEALTARATLLLESGNPPAVKSAVRSFEELVRRKPEDASLHFNLAMGHLMAGEIDAGRTEAIEALRHQSDLNKARFLLANIAFAQNKPGDALRYADEILSRIAEDPTARLIKAESLMSLQRYSEARGELNRLGNQYPGSAEVQLQFATLALLEQKYPEAQQRLLKLRSNGVEEVRATLGLAETYARQRQFDKALQLLSEGAVKTKNVDLRKGLAETALQARKFDLAIAEYQQLIAASPSSADLVRSLGRAYEQKGDFDSAITQYRQAQHLDPANVASHFYLAGALVQSGRASDALPIYRELASSRPNDVDALNNLAVVICETGGNLDEALNSAKRAAQKAPNQPEILDTLAWVYFKKGMTDSAVKLLTGVVSKKSESPTIHYHFGAALARQGAKEQAREELRVALSKNPSPLQEKSIRSLLAEIG